MYLKLSSMIESQLRDAYARKHAAGVLNQSSLANKLGVNRSAVHHRLTGQTNMTIETIADMIWGLDHDIDLKIFDPAELTKNHRAPEPIAPSPSREHAIRADTPLMKIASTAPTSNTAAQQLLGGSREAHSPQTSQSYSAQLFGHK